MEQSGVRTLLHAFLLEAVLLPLAHNWGFWYNTLDGLIYGIFILAAKGMWHLIDFGQSFYMAAALNEQIRKHTVLEDFPLFCPKCRYTCVIRFKDGKMEETVPENA